MSDNVPANYSVFTTAVLDALVRLDMNTCNKLSVNHVDAGSANYSMLMVALNDPNPSGTGSNMDDFWYVLEIRTDSPDFASWVSLAGLDAGDGKVLHRYSPLPMYAVETETSVQSASGEVYRVHGFPPNSNNPEEHHYRHYYGPDPSANFWDETFVWFTSTSGAGEFNMSEDSGMAHVLGAASPGPAFLTAIVSGSRSYAPAQPSYAG